MEGVRSGLEFHEMCQQLPLFSRNMSAVTEVITKFASSGFGFHEIQYISFNKMRWQGPGSPNDMYFMQCVSNVQGFHETCQQLAKDFTKFVNNVYGFHEMCLPKPGIDRKCVSNAQ